MLPSERGGRTNTNPRTTAHPRWYVTATHTVGAYAAERPYGIRHARSPGDRFTACGLRAVDWPLFWDLPFHGRQERACRTCAQHVLQGRAEP